MANHPHSHRDEPTPEARDTEPVDAHPDTKFQGKGEARGNVGDTARDSAAKDAGYESDRRDEPDEFDRDLDR